jgi:hypothetical protein
MHHVGTRREHVFNLFSQAGKIGGQNGRGYLVIGHGRTLFEWENELALL